MAKGRLNVLFFGYPYTAPIIERILKKSLSPSQYNLLPFLVGSDERAKMQDSLQYEQFRSQSLRSARITVQYQESEALALTGLGVHPSAHIAIAIYDRPTIVGTGLASHLGVHAVLIDSQRDGGVLSPPRTVAFVSETIAPYLGTTGTTTEQLERNCKTVLRNLFEGWVAWSERHDGVIKHIRAA